MRHYYLADGLGSVGGLSDSTGALSRSYKYDPFGALRSTTGSTPNPFMYIGQYLDPSGVIYKMGARYYVPLFGRWSQQDPLDQAGDLRQGNRYVYAASDPINLSDPTGTISLPITGCWWPVCDKKDSAKENLNECAQALAVGASIQYAVKKLFEQPWKVRPGLTGLGLSCIAGAAIN